MTHPLAKRLYDLIGQRVRQSRLEIRMTQGELAARAHVGRTTITNLELGNQQVPLHQLLSIADVLGVEFQQFIPKREELGGISPIPMLVSGHPSGASPRAAMLIEDFLNRHPTEEITKETSDG